ncbi:GNAT family N-acetyltransferase [Massilia oculi]|uniref:GNAT family N-acetyltransferase n=1 Tax=Massilia oculi TaxID=945844 RepID=UPI001AAF0E58|nr:GNAT family N-acetyltransferase [Massilia oculi]
MSWRVVPAAEAALPEHLERWRRLHGQSAGSPLLAPEFVLPLLAVFGTGREVLAWHERDGETDIMALLAPSRPGAWDTFQPAQAPVGLWLQRDARPRPDLLPGLLRALPGPALMLGLTQCDPMLMERPAAGAGLRTMDYIETARVTLPASFDEYWNTRGKNLRGNLRKQRKRLQDDGVPTRLQASRAVHEMAAAVEDYGRLESAGWKAKDGTAVSAGNEQGRFYRAMLEAFAAIGAACVYRYFIGERLAAMDLCVEGGGCIVVLKTAYDEGIGNGLSPALLMREEATRDIIESRRFERIEFYGRVMEWHLRWTGEVRTMYHLNAYRWPWLGRLHARAAGRAA